MIRFENENGVQLVNPAHIVSVVDTPDGCVVSLSNGSNLQLSGVKSEEFMRKLGTGRGPGVVAPVNGRIPELRLKGG